MNKILGITAILMTAIFASGVLAAVPANTLTATVDPCNSNSQCGDGTPICVVSSGSLGPFATIAQPPNVGFAHGTITVQDLGTAYKWTFTITDSAPHYGVGLVVSKDNVNPAFQVYFADFGDKSWHYQPYGTTCWSGTDTTALPTEITATGDGTTGTFTITIQKSLFTAAPSWAAQVRTTLLGIYPAWTPWCGPFVFQSIQASCVAASCGVSASGIAFGALVPGQTKGDDLSVTSTLTNSGNTPTTSLGIQGTAWNSNPWDGNSMAVGQTSWSVGSGWNVLTGSNAAMGTNVAPSSPLTAYFKLAVPLNQPADNYQQTITLTTGC